MDPPAYSSTTELVDTSRHELPTYNEVTSSSHRSSRRAITTHEYKMHLKRGISWVALRVDSKAKTPDHLPHFMSGDTVAGAIVLDMQEDTTIKGVTLSFTGDLIAPNTASFEFLKIAQEIYSSKGDPRSTNAEDTENSPPPPRKEKLHGNVSWPFSFAIPREVQVKSGRNTNTFPLPASFMERGANITVLYRLSITVFRGMLLPTCTVDTTVVYVPRIKPEAPSPAIQLAYQERCPLIGPSDDQEGWHTLDPIIVSGTLFNARNCGIVCTLSLAKPLCYTRSTTIPLFLKLECTDTQALNMLSTESAPTVRLRRSIRVDNRDPQVPGSMFMNPNSDTNLDKAVWWPSPFDSPTDDQSETRILQGEIRLPQSLVPTAHLHHYHVFYSVALFPFQAVGFTAAHPTNTPLQSVQVEIATMFAHGPRPVSYSALFVPT
ncbi:hypothetical protein NM688_g5478 [Phlebia brevispora]|uniref:Uncharacterized protein n=1 Tax=Phlebia brevispora TaxID=194682 RepID=A0ACC1SUN3_9APHY|nr:hypothetical protein NM688_g5478 [Phlebia brevispora]